MCATLEKQSKLGRSNFSIFAYIKIQYVFVFTKAHYGNKLENAPPSSSSINWWTKKRGNFFKKTIRYILPEFYFWHKRFPSQHQKMISLFKNMFYSKISFSKCIKYQSLKSTITWFFRNLSFDWKGSLFKCTAFKTYYDTYIQ